MHDEGPSPEDLERFGEPGGAYCPHCGAEVWEDAPRCPSCDAWIHATRMRHPAESEFRRKVIVVIAVLLALALVGFFGLRIF